MKINRTMSKLLLIVPILLAACYPQGPDFTTDYDVVITNHNPDYNFKAKTTFAIPDKIVKITGNVITGDPPKFVPQAYASIMLTQMTLNMTNNGYTKVDISANPDLILIPSEMETTTISYWYDYWGWYWGGYYPGWGYPGYGYPVYASSYTTGTLLMNLVDPKVLGGNGNPIIQWSGAPNGILTNAFDAGRVNPLIDKAFSQSPYLKRN